MELSINANGSLGLLLFSLDWWVVKLIYFSIVFGITFILKIIFSWKIRCEIWNTILQIMKCNKEFCI